MDRARASWRAVGAGLGDQTEAGEDGDDAAGGAVVAALAANPQPASQRVVLNELHPRMSAVRSHLVPTSLRHLSTAFLRFLRPRRASFLLLCLVINGCGSGNRPSAASSSAAAELGGPASDHDGARGNRRRTATASARRPAAATATPATAATPLPPAGNARLPARFVITARGSLNPPSVSAPPGRDHRPDRQLRRRPRPPGRAADDAAAVARGARRRARVAPAHRAEERALRASGRRRRRGRADRRGPAGALTGSGVSRSGTRPPRHRPAAAARRRARDRAPRARAPRSGTGRSGAAGS